MNKITKIEGVGAVLRLDTITSRALKNPNEKNIEKAVDLFNDENGFYIIVDNNKIYLQFANKSYKVTAVKHEKVAVFAPSLFNGIRLTEKAEKDLMESENHTILYRFKERDYKVVMDENGNISAYTDCGKIVSVMEN